MEYANFNPTKFLTTLNEGVQTMSRNFQVGIIYSLVILLALAVFPIRGKAQEKFPVKISPHKIVLNAEGNSESIQAIVNMPGSRVVSCEIDLLFNNTVVASTTSARYCFDHDNLLVYFNREAIIASDVVRDMAGRTVEATIEGFVIFEGGATVHFTAENTGTDTVEIVAPGNKK
jgi:hypothetical protein